MKRKKSDGIDIDGIELYGEIFRLVYFEIEKGIIVCRCVDGNPKNHFCYAGNNPCHRYRVVAYRLDKSK